MDTETLTDVASTAAQQMSMWDLVWASDMVTKVVMIGLIAASVWSWAIIIEKIGTLRQVKQFTKSFEEKFWSGGSLDRLYESIGNRPRDPMSAMFVSAMKEWKRTNILKSKTDRGIRGVSLQQRIEKAMMVSMDKELDELDTRMAFWRPPVRLRRWSACSERCGALSTALTPLPPRRATPCPQWLRVLPRRCLRRLSG